MVGGESGRGTVFSSPSLALFEGEILRQAEGPRARPSTALFPLSNSSVCLSWYLLSGYPKTNMVEIV